MSVLKNTALKTDHSNGLIYEVWTFDNKVQKTKYSHELHLMNFIAAEYGKNIEIYKDYNFVEKKYKEKTQQKQ